MRVFSVLKEWKLLFDLKQLPRRLNESSLGACSIEGLMFLFSWLCGYCDVRNDMMRIENTAYSLELFVAMCRYIDHLTLQQCTLLQTRRERLTNTCR